MRRTVIIAVLLIAAVVPAAALQRGKPTKPAPKNQPTRGVKGTTQMAGDNGKMGVTYTIGNGADAIVFTLLSAEYTTQRVLTPQYMVVPKTDEKFLVLHYTLHNPQPREFTVNWATLSITAIDSKDTNHNLAGGGAPTVLKEDANEGLGIALKPSQKVAARTVIRIPADVSVPKLIVQRMKQEPVLRIYFKDGDVKPVPAPFADPADSKGCTALANVPGAADTYYQFQHFDAKLVGTGYVDGKLMNRDPGKGNRFFVATITAKNPATYAWTLNGFTFQTTAKTDDGERTRLSGNIMLKAKRDEQGGTSVGPGEEYTFRIAIPVPSDAKVTEFTLREGEGFRTLVFPITTP